MKIYAYAMVDFVVATLAARPSARVAQPIIERVGAPRVRRVRRVRAY